MKKTSVLILAIFVLANNSAFGATEKKIAAQDQSSSSQGAAVVAKTGNAGVTPSEAGPLPDSADVEFSKKIQHNSIGSPIILVIESKDTLTTTRFGVSPEHVDENIEMLNKFLKWAAMARERGDVLEKDIGMVKGFEFGLLDYYNFYQFTTSSRWGETKYYVSIQPGNKVLGYKWTPKRVNDDTAGSDDDFKMLLSEDGAKQAIKRMQEFKDGKLKTRTEIESDYK